MEFDSIKRDWERAGSYAPTYDDAFPKEGYAPKSDNCHDDGPRTCFGLGGIGTGNFGRDLDGRFSRWHLQNGYHRHLPVDAAHLRVRWRRGDTVENHRLCRDGNDDGLPDGAHSVRPLFPVMRERIAADEWPVEMYMENYSPVIPGDYEASALPVAFFDLHVRNRCDETVEFDAAFFWGGFNSEVQESGQGELGACESARLGGKLSVDENIQTPNSRGTIHDRTDA